MKHQPSSREETVPAAQPLPAPVSREGVDLTLIRELRAMTPTDRADALAHAANAMAKLRRDVRKV